MTFKEARQELRRIAGKRYCTISFQESFFSSGRKETTCFLSVDFTGVNAGSWEMAFEVLNMKLFGKATEEEPEI